MLKGRRERARGIVVPAEIVYLPSYLPGALSYCQRGLGSQQMKGKDRVLLPPPQHMPSLPLSTPHTRRRVRHDGRACVIPHCDPSPRVQWVQSWVVDSVGLTHV